MLNSDKLKSEIDKIPKEYYGLVLDLLKSIKRNKKYKYIATSKISDNSKISWQNFISQTYGSLSATPIKRGSQGNYEIREEIA